jgi:hypothetical protein
MSTSAVKQARWRNYLRKRGVELVNESNNGLQCQTCGQFWSVNQPPHGQRFPRGYWHCPRGCNHD